MQLCALFLLGNVSSSQVFAAAKETPAPRSPCVMKRVDSDWHFTPSMPETFWQPDGALRKIKDGLALTVEQHISLFKASDVPPVKVLGRCRINYDLWAETYFVKKQLVASDSENKPEKIEEHKFSYSQGAQALKNCLTLLLPRADFVSVQGEVLLNPVDKEQEKRTRDWLATKGIGGTGAGVVGRAMGAVMNLSTESTVAYDCKR